MQNFKTQKEKAYGSIAFSNNHSNQSISEISSPKTSQPSSEKQSSANEEEQTDNSLFADSLISKLKNLEDKESNKTNLTTREEIMEALPEEIPPEIVTEAERKGSKLLAEHKEVLENTGLDGVINTVAMFALLLQDVGKKLAPDQAVIHLGKKFSENPQKKFPKLPATIEIHKKPDGTQETVIKIDMLGEGGFKTVSLACIFETGELFARAKSRIKYKELPTIEDLEKEKHAEQATKNEAKYLTLLKDVPHIIQTHSITSCSTPVSNDYVKEHQILLLEYCDKGSLNELIENSVISNRVKNKIAQELLEGVIGMHAKGVINRDLKLDNILIKTDPNNPKEIKVVITDFGLAIEKDDPKIEQEIRGTPPYIAPEVWAHSPKIDINDPERLKLTYEDITSKVDDWSVGCILWKLFTGKDLPWEGIMSQPNWTAFKAGFEMMSRKNNLPEPARDSPEWIAWKMLRPNPKDRMSKEEALSRLKNYF